MPLQLLKYAPGIVKDITDYSAGKNGPFFVDGSLVRFRNGFASKIGGWIKDQIKATRNHKKNRLTWLKECRSMFLSIAQITMRSEKSSITVATNKNAL